MIAQRQRVGVEHRKRPRHVADLVGAVCVGETAHGGGRIEIVLRQLHHGARDDAEPARCAPQQHETDRADQHKRDQRRDADPIGQPRGARRQPLHADCHGLGDLPADLPERNVQGAGGFRIVTQPRRCFGGVDIDTRQ